MKSPLIALTTSARGTGFSARLSALGLRWAGARVRVLRPPYRAGLFEGIDGVVIGGGAHIEPSRYAEQPSREHAYEAERDELEWRVLETASARGLPVLGICRGAQLLNVFRGGNLYQDLVADIPGLRLSRSVRARKWVEVEPDSALRGVLDVPRVRVNSLHHQGVRRLGEGLRIAARDADGIVQAIESVTAGDAFGVQWHPEYLLDCAPHRRLFRWLVGACRR